MPVEAFIQTGKHTLLSYLIKPLRDQLLYEYRQN
jgi:HlyD family secretion protein